LEAVEKHGSVSAASKHLDMSYRYALHRVSLAERRLGCELIMRHRGGAAGGTSELTADGKELIVKYRKIEKEIKKLLRPCSFNLIKS
jgi:molybdate transport system regulatory protein